MSMLRVDPTRTTMLRRAFTRNLAARIAHIQAATRQKVVNADAFARNPVVLNAGVWGTLPPARQVSEFKLWFGELVTSNVLGGWLDQYVRNARTRGADRAYTQVHKQPRPAAITSIAKQDFRRGVIQGREAQAQFNLLYEQVYNTLEGVTDRLRKDVAMAIAQGITAKEAPATLQTRVDAIFTKASEIWVPEFTNTAVTLSHAEGQLDAFQWLGIRQVGIIVEWQTSGAGSCPRCAARAGQQYTIDEAHGLIPLHKHCRCAWGVPLIVRA